VGVTQMIRGGVAPGLCLLLKTTAA